MKSFIKGLAAFGAVSLFSATMASAAQIINYTLSNSEITSPGTVVAETGQTGTYGAGVTPGGSVAPGASGQSFGFVGANYPGTFGSALDTPGVATDSNMTGKFSYDFWVNPAAGNSNAYISNNQAGSSYAVLYNYNGLTNTVQFYSQDYGGEVAISNVTVAPGTWTNIAYTYDGTLPTPTFTTYVNGANPVSDSVTIPLGNFDGSDLTLGGYAANAGNFNGSIYNYQIYDSVLSAGEVADLAAVPEPATLSILAIGSIGLLARRRSRIA